MPSRSTDELMKILSAVSSHSGLSEFTAQTEKTSACRSFAEYISEKLVQTGISAADLVQGSGIQRTYCYQILDGRKNPGRDKVIALCLALTLPLDEVQRALTIAGHAVLYPKRRRDSIIIFSINQSLTVSGTNSLLFEMGEDPLE